MKFRSTPPSEFCCSFCRKPQSDVTKLISNPADYPRAYICDECIAVCASILADDEPGSPPTSGLLVFHPRLPKLMAALGNWIACEDGGLDSSRELAEVRRLARLIFGHTH